MIEVGYLAALLGGVLTLISPCGALLLPSFFAYAFGRPTALLARTGLFYLGLAATLVPLGMGASFASALFFGHRDVLILVAGWLVIALGVAQIVGGGFALGLAQRAQGRLAGRTGTGAVFGLGAVYGLAGFCSGPILGAVLTVAASDGRPLHGGALLAVYAFGMAGPLFLLALGWDRFDLGNRRWLRGRTFTLGRLRLHTTSLVAGLLFIGVGVLFLSTGGTASGIPGLPSSVRAEATAQAWLQRVDAAIPDGALLGAVGAIALAVLLTRLWRARRPTEATTDPSLDAAGYNVRTFTPAAGARHVSATIHHLRPTTFAAAVGCIDGRVHPALSRFVAERHGVDAVDLVTEPGADGALASGDEATLTGVLRRLDPSCAAHACQVIVVAGHEDCAAMPGDLDDHRQAVARAIERLRAAVDDRFLVEGALVHLDGSVEVV